MLVHIPGSGRAPRTMVSLPRDSYVEIHGNGPTSSIRRSLFGGPALLAHTLEQAAGHPARPLRRDRFRRFRGAGRRGRRGEDVPGRAPLRPLAGIDLPAGSRSSTAQALGYVRTRATPRADLDRMVSQRQFMSALLHRAASPSVALNPLRWYPVAHAAADSLTVDSGAHVTDLARLAWALRGNISTTTVPHRRIHRKQLGFGRGVGREPRRPAVRSAQVGRRRAAGRARRRGHPLVAPGPGQFTCRATLRIRSMSPTDVPPNFRTRRAMGCDRSPGARSPSEPGRSSLSSMAVEAAVCLPLRRAFPSRWRRQAQCFASGPAHDRKRRGAVATTDRRSDELRSPSGLSKASITYRLVTADNAGRRHPRR